MSDGYICRDCGACTDRKNSRYVRGWEKLGYCPECIRKRKDYWRTISK